MTTSAPESPLTQAPYVRTGSAALWKRLIIVILISASGAWAVSEATEKQAAVETAKRSLDEALRTAEPQHVRAAIQQNLENASENAWAATLEWMEKRRKALGRSELEWGWEQYLAFHPAGRGATGVRWELALSRLARTSRQDRAAVYRDALHTGRAKISEGVLLTRSHVLQLAAMDGIEEFENGIRDHSEELVRALGRPIGVVALLDTLRWRAGATDRAAAVRQHAAGIRRLRPEDVRGRVQEDEGFRKSTIDLTREACTSAEGGEEACGLMRLVLDAQYGSGGTAETVTPAVEAWRTWREALRVAVSSRDR